MKKIINFILINFVLIGMAYAMQSEISLGDPNQWKVTASQYDGDEKGGYRLFLPFQRGERDCWYR